MRQCHAEPDRPSITASANILSLSLTRPARATHQPSDIPQVQVALLDVLQQLGGRHHQHINEASEPGLLGVGR